MGAMPLRFCFVMSVTLLPGIINRVIVESVQDLIKSVLVNVFGIADGYRDLHAMIIPRICGDVKVQYIPVIFNIDN
jgi:hypothetical protein